MNSLIEKYGDKLAILAFPCNQFGHQTNENNDEILNTLKHVRPGGGFEPKCEMFSKVNVNGADSHPLWSWLRTSLKVPCDPEGDTKGNGMDDVDALVLPRGGFGGTTLTLWSPVSRTDVAWNFEKFLLDKTGAPVKRFSRYYKTGDIASDIDSLL